MRQVTLTSLKNELQTLADQVGEKRFGSAKALYLDKVMVTDEDGTPVAAEDLEVILAPKKAVEEAEDEEMKAAEDVEEDEEEVTPKSIAPIFRKGLRQSAAASAPSIIRPRCGVLSRTSRTTRTVKASRRPSDSVDGSSLRPGIARA
jgi:carbamoylphosphate synthase large subunit